jgi:alkanesulfonate monooxygenase SsuD/methylene tetrahydromethanopterin reductase-like flavin-dependent oxidoreductase (luciferase family)
MEFGVFALNPGWLDGHWAELEASPFAALYVPDHPSMPAPDPWTFLAYAAAQTRRIRLGTHVTGAPFHNAAELARTVASVDALSGGRAVLGLGAGWMRGDFRALGIRRAPFAERVAQLDEMVRALPGLWAQRAATVQQPHPPIVVATNRAGRAAETAAGHAQGVNTWQLGPDQVRLLVEHLRERCVAAGRDPATLKVTADVLFARDRNREEAAALAERVANFGATGGRGGPATEWHVEGVLYGDADHITGQVQAFAAAGVEELSVALSNMADLAWFAERVAGR